jgi:hypothetical protein
VTAGALSAAVDALSREEAAEAARDELAKRPYQDAQPSLAVRAITWVLERLADLLDTAAATAPGGLLGVLLLLALLAAVVAVVLTRLRPGRTGSGRMLFDAGRTLTAADHRTRAAEAAAAGRFDDAVRERLRAVVRELEARGVLDPRPGRTADEVAREAGAAVPEVAGDLRRAVQVFDEVWYGGRPATAESYRVLVEVDDRLVGRRLAVR